MDIRRLYLGSLHMQPKPLTHVHGYLVLHPAGPIMIDTGFGATMAGDSEESSGTVSYGDSEMVWVRRTSVEALADHGVLPEDVKYVISTHLYDHAGENYMFPGARFFVQRPEWEFRSDSPFKDAWDFPGLDLQLLNGEDREILPGVTCLFTPGHTPGHQSVLVEHDEKTLFVGDASYFIDFWDDPEEVRRTGSEGAQVGVTDGWDLWLDSLSKLKRQNADTVHFSHDTRILQPSRR